MKSAVQIKSDLRNQQVIYTVDESLNALKGKNLAPKKLAEANKMLNKIKGSLPDSLKPGSNP